MMAPNMATMLCFLTTDAAVTLPPLLHEALLDAVGDTFNMLTVDGDTSTNDTVALLANGAAENPLDLLPKGRITTPFAARCGCCVPRSSGPGRRRRGRDPVAGSPVTGWCVPA